MTWIPNSRWSLWGAGLITLVPFLGFILELQLVRLGDSEVLEEFVESRRSIFTVLMRGVTFLFDPLFAVVVAVLAAGIIWWYLRSPRAGFYVLAAVSLSALFTQVFKHLFSRARPEQIWQLIPEASFSYPSGHTTAVTSLCASLAIVALARQVSRRDRLITLVISVSVAALVAASRLYLGVHWFTDIAGGTLVGVGTALLISPFSVPSPRKRGGGQASVV